MGFVVDTEHRWGAGRFHRCVKSSGWVGGGSSSCLSAVPNLGHLVPALPPCCGSAFSQPLCPTVDALSRGSALPKLGPRLGEIVSTLGHTLAQQWDSRVTIYRSESPLEAAALGPTAVTTLGLLAKTKIRDSHTGHHTMRTEVSRASWQVPRRGNRGSLF